MFIWWGPDLIQFYNDAYRKTMGPERHPSALGQKGRECWDEIWDIIGPQIEYVMAGEGATWHEDQLVPVTRHGKREDVWWTYGYSPIDDESGAVGGVLVVCNDVTGQHTAREQLRTSFEQAPGFVAILSGPDHVFDLVNDGYKTLIAGREVIGKPLRDALPEVAEQGFVDLLDEVYKTGKTFGAKARAVMLAAPNGAMEQHFLDFIYQPIVDHTSTVTGILVQGYDVTEEVQAQRRAELLARELDHRVKNSLATVRAIASQTLRQDRPIGEAYAAFDDRLGALARTHDLLRVEPEQGVGLAKIVGVALEHVADRPERFTTSGPNFRLSSRAATSLSMALHELSTNALKYGALSAPEGRVDILWQIDAARPDAMFRLRWSENGGPVVHEPQSLGFGSRLIERGLAMELGGTASIRYEPTGVVCDIEAPLLGLTSD